MKSLKDLKAAYIAKPTAKLPFVIAMYDIHKYLFEYAEILKDTDISSIQITDDQIVMTFRESGVKMLLMKGDTSIPPLTAFNFGSYEKEELNVALRLIGKNMKEDSTVLDIGANVGWFSLHVANQFRNVTVCAFEPIPYAFECLKNNISLNNFTNIKPLNIGLSNERKTREFYCDPVRCGSASLTNIAEVENVDVILCEVRTLDDVVKENNTTVDFIKCDVEGAELFVFQGGLETIDKYKPVILTEMLRKWSAKFHYHPNDIIRLLRGYGYQCYRIINNELEIFHEMDDNTVETNFLFIHPSKRIC
jgi:FkbM family methyltransferase